MTETNVLSAIKSIYDKQGFNHKPIGVDTLLLVLKIRANELLPLLNTLQLNGEIVCHTSKSASAKRGAIKYGTITLTESDS